MELSFKLSSISAVIISSFTNNPTLQFGLVPYWSRRRVSLFTLQNWPWTKYTPSWIWKEDPVTAALFATVIAKGAPVAMVVFPNKPELIIVLHVNSSPSKNVWVELFVVLEVK